MLLDMPANVFILVTFDDVPNVFISATASLVPSKAKSATASVVPSLPISVALPATEVTFELIPATVVTLA